MVVIGEVRAAAQPIELNSGRERITIEVTNESARPVRVSSHYPFWLANRRLSFDRDSAKGFHLDLPSGASVRWGPGEVRRVVLVRLGGSP